TKRNTNLTEVVLRQIMQDRVVDGILSECRLILFEAKAPQPTPEVHNGALALLTRNHRSRETTCPAHCFSMTPERSSAPNFRRPWLVRLPSKTLRERRHAGWSAQCQLRTFCRSIASSVRHKMDMKPGSQATF